MQLKTLLLPLSLAAVAIADGESVLAAITEIGDESLVLNDVISSWNGHLLTAIPIIFQSTSLLSTINDGTETAEASENLTLAESIQVATAVTELQTSVNTTLETTIARKPDFDKLLLSTTILLSLNQLKDASGEFSDALVSKLPEALQPTGESLAAEIEDSFNYAISIYNPFD
ncbi:uncharacterized protein MKZ38_010076 [Zalerion maritima]|uniref:Uncharacterized protein n=1 Tax=Zalerion maritima TaxID=339359 RepID=A0AAD5RTL1_9PEZI|nr:uncharacterized protein MKZ38_010076 [Zalerion maritima]